MQGFPDTYNFCGTRPEVIQQIGNSVSPKLGKHLALAIASQIFNLPTCVKLIPLDKKLSFDKRKGQAAKLTREKHDRVASCKTSSIALKLEPYSERVEPCTLPEGQSNVKVTVKGKRVAVTVRGDEKEKLFAKVHLEIACNSPNLFSSRAEQMDAILRVNLYGKSPHCIQTMWNAIDSWVIRSSNLHSLFELYGHFTEPHPIFSIVSFKACSRHPIATFAAHAAKFENCSKYLPRTHLTNLFGKAFKTRTFADLVKVLRGYRFDIRCFETNVAIPPSNYMVVYPFTLPNRKQINFSVKSRHKAEDRTRPDVPEMSSVFRQQGAADV